MRISDWSSDVCSSDLLTPEDIPVVIGCGPVGLAVIAGLKIKGVHPIIAADFSPGRRKLAETMGADIVLDPAEHSPRSEERRVGKECVSTCRSRWSPSH